MLPTITSLTGKQTHQSVYLYLSPCLFIRYAFKRVIMVEAESILMRANIDSGDVEITSASTMGVISA